MVNWNNERPVLEEKVSALGIGKAIYAAPDGDKNNARLLLAADGFHFRQSDFSDFEFNNIIITSSVGEKYNISFGDDGQLLINGAPFTVPTNQNDEVIAGNKELIGQTRLSGGLQLVSPNGTFFNVDVNDDGSLSTEEVTNA
ncbi:hypothetical protein EFL35_01590 [Weissella paramesenteroides]|uniref:hypothetical protein n=1 Tax=Weissella paramesenteroides TaxID=1249 RepID=UPI00223B4C41|nr:hypothetical protein [Weissella paramesenteroides]MCS9983691.1 hypothetical protein [Weissella paramesenteroides]MCS9997946.1 hypothetical protein [Weissella paramesenteroides]MCT0260164.1 hypothetical protein [Weissella paramesenteroides]